MNDNSLKITAPYDKAALTKANVSLAAENIVSEVLAGHQSGIEVFAKIRYLEAVLAEAKAQIEETTMIELQKQDGNKCGFGGVELAYKQGSRRYVYDHNPAYVEAKEQMKAIEEMMKVAIKSEIADTETGEVAPPAKETYTKDSITASIK